MRKNIYQRAQEYSAQEDERGKRARRASIRRHTRKCTVCNHPDRESIEQDYLRWHSPETIGRDFEINNAAVYRHAHATGLLARRQAGLRATLENFLECADDVRVTAGSIISAMRLYAQMNDSGGLIRRTKTYIVERLPNGTVSTTCTTSAAPPSASAPSVPEPSKAQDERAKKPISNRKPAKLESPLNPSVSAKDPALIANFQPSPRTHKRAQRIRK